VLLGLTAAAQIIYGVLAIGGVEALEANVREIERDPRFGTLYLSLPAWGALLIVIGSAELTAAWRLSRRAPHARLACLAAALFGLAAAFFTLALFHLAALITVVLLLSAIYVLSYRVDD
jgi:hypothetical protein